MSIWLLIYRWESAVSDSSGRYSWGNSQTCLCGWVGFFTNHFQELSCSQSQWPGPLLASLPQRYDVHCQMHGPRCSDFASWQEWLWVKHECRPSWSRPPRRSISSSVRPSTLWCFRHQPAEYTVLVHHRMQMRNILELSLLFPMPFKPFYGNRYLHWTP